jgi:hypothetical protein
MSLIDLNSLREAFDLRNIINADDERTYVHQADGEERKLVSCPFHADTNPSLDVGRTLYSCFGCGAWGSIIDWIAHTEGLGFKDAIERAVELSGLDAEQLAAPPDYTDMGLPRITDPIKLEALNGGYEQLVKEARERLFDSDALLALYERWAIDTASSWYFELGLDNGNFVIPVRNRHRELLTLRWKRFGKPSGPKYWGITGRNPPILYNEQSLYMSINGDVIFGMQEPVRERPSRAIICFGELSAIVCQQAFSLLGETVASVSPTNGTNSWVRSWRRRFTKCKEIFIIPDVGEESYAVDVASCFPDRVKIVILDGDRGFDVNDYMLHRSPEDLRNLIEENSVVPGDVFRYYSRGGGRKWDSI